MTVTESATHVTVTTPNDALRPTPPSIRSIIRGDILAGIPKSETQARVLAFHPESAATAKFAKHYGWYKGQVKKEGKLPAAKPVA